MTDRPTTEQFAWKAHPAKQRPGGAGLAFLVILGLAAATYVSFGVFWAVAAAAILFLSMNRFFLPSRFEIDAQGITARYPLRRQYMRWADVRRFVHDDRGGYLSTRSRRSRLDAYQGMHLIFDAADREMVVQRIGQRVLRAAASAGEEADVEATAAVHQAGTLGGKPCGG